ncbi:hypothetical protein ROZALSC1DRAFT_19112 [Rozella allomycis CSF55]|uniref:THIF-type NAD/FAD binding fold domain-containing protein n=1 Tax=Rozella allomycis (strain CSF55) TaxID=988480 RepID=A0A4P9YM77_ROZAC|nr:hypothetical protein ROZALSC1DRAFT_19112 [Rozella allomycis CSF55]
MSKSLLFLGAMTVAFTVTYFSVKSNLKGKKRERKFKNIQKNTIFDETLIREQLSRNYLYFGDEKMEKIRNSFVVVVGAGGVGSHAISMLIRTGVGKIRIIDFDQVTLSSLNRHACAVHSDVGTSKVECIKQYFSKVAPWCDIEIRNEMYNLEKSDVLLSGNPDFVIDCIDNIKTKVELLKYCHENKIPVVSSMGAGAKCDPTSIQICDISESSEDPLAKATRKSLKKFGITDGIPVVYSTERANGISLMPLSEDNVNDAKQFAPFDDFRVRILPVLGTLPALFGNTIATYVLLKITNWEHFHPLVAKNRTALYTKFHKDLVLKEGQKINLTISDLKYVFEQIWFGRSITSLDSDNLILVKWRKENPLSMFNLVCLTKNESKLHESYENLEDAYGLEFVSSVDNKLDRERTYLWDKQKS